MLMITKKIRDIKIRLNGDNTNHRLNKIIYNTENAGSLCTRFLGAGGGGFFVCWAPKIVIMILRILWILKLG